MTRWDDDRCKHIVMIISPPPFCVGKSSVAPDSDPFNTMALKVTWLFFSSQNLDPFDTKLLRHSLHS